MRKFYFIIFIALFGLIVPKASFAQTFTKVEGTPFVGMYSSKVEWGDYDNDGDMDIVHAGFDGSDRKISIYRNDGNSNFVLVDEFIGNENALWGDFDDDGDLDIFAFEGYVPTIIRNVGNDSFVDLNSGFRSLIYTSSKIGDLDNDNDLDIVYSGVDAYSTNHTVFLINNGTGGFTETSSGLQSVSSGSIDLGDYDNDGDLDIALAGELATVGTETNKIYRNDGGLSFIDINLGLEGFHHGDMEWGDYDNDSDLDLMFSGDVDGVNGVSKIYRNDGNDSFTDIGANLACITQGSITWVDIDSDNDLDIIQTDGNLDNNTKIYKNDAGVFSIFPHSLPAVTGSDVDVCDYDNDGDMDILIAGHNISKSICELYQNDIPHIPNCLADATITVSDATATQNTNFSVPITTTEITADCNMSAFQFVVTYDASKMDYVGFNQTGTLSEGSMVVVNANTPGILNVVMASGSPAVTGVGSLIDLEFKATSCESSNIEISDFYYNTQSNTNLVNGTVTVSADYNVTVNDAYGIVGKTFSTAVSVSELFAGCNSGEYSFTLNYDDRHIEYTAYDLASTLDPSATVTVDNSTIGQLTVNVTSSSPLSGIGDLIYLEFNTLTKGSSTLDIENFVLDGQAATTITDGTVTSYAYGDIDNDGMVMGMDASIVLQYSVDPNQVISGINFPWEDWRIAIADVNADGSINSTDAVLIMQYTAGMITEFPAESSKKSTSDFQDVELSVEMVDGNLVFTTSAGLLGFDLLSVDGDVSKLGEPENLSNMMIASNTKNGNYKIAMARAMANEETEDFLSIPVGEMAGELTFNMLANNYTKTYTYKAGVTSVEDLKLSTGFLAYPNPVNTELNLKFKLAKAGNVSLRILDNTGKLVEQLVSNKLSEGEHQYNWSRKGNAAGIYHVEFINGNNKMLKKIILK